MIVKDRSCKHLNRNGYIPIRFRAKKTAKQKNMIKDQSPRHSNSKWVWTKWQSLKINETKPYDRDKEINLRSRPIYIFSTDF